MQWKLLVTSSSFQQSKLDDLFPFTFSLNTTLASIEICGAGEQAFPADRNRRLAHRQLDATMQLSPGR
jgi:hypothetical protein